MSLVVQTNPVLSFQDDTNANNPVIGYDNVATAANLSVTSQDPLYPATNLLNPSTPPIQAWKSLIATEQYITVTYTGTISYAALAAHNLATAQVPVGFEVQYASNPGVWVVVIDPAMLPDDGPALFRFNEVDVVAARFHLLASLVATIPYSAIMYIGKALLLPRRIYIGHTPINFGRTSEVYSPRSEKGHFLGRVLQSQSLNTTVNMANITEAWYRTYFEPFVKATIEKPFFFAWRPEDFPLETGFVWWNSDPRMSNQRSNGMVQFNMDLGGIATQ